MGQIEQLSELVEVIPEWDTIDDLVRASESTLGFWNNYEDDVWNNA